MFVYEYIYMWISQWWCCPFRTHLDPSSFVSFTSIQPPYTQSQSHATHYNMPMWAPNIRTYIGFECVASRARSFSLRCCVYSYPNVLCVGIFTFALWRVFCCFLCAGNIIRREARALYRCIVDRLSRLIIRNLVGVHINAIHPYTLSEIPRNL